MNDKDAHRQTGVGKFIDSRSFRPCDEEKNSPCRGQYGGRFPAATPLRGSDSADHQYQQTVEAHLIFLPAAGYRNGTSVNNLGTNGYYWSSTLNAGSPNNARRLNFNSTEANVNNNNRYNGFSVRAVLSTCHLLRTRVHPFM